MADQYKALRKSHGDHWYQVRVSRRVKKAPRGLDKVFSIKDYANNNQAYAKATEYALRVLTPSHRIHIVEYRIVNDVIYPVRTYYF